MFGLFAGKMNKSPLEKLKEKYVNYRWSDLKRDYFATYARKSLIEGFLELMEEGKVSKENYPEMLKIALKRKFIKQWWDHIVVDKILGANEDYAFINEFLQEFFKMLPSEAERRQREKQIHSFYLVLERKPLKVLYL